MNEFADLRERLPGILKALAAGVPLLCVPLGRDQHDNAARVTWHEAGLRLDADASSEDMQLALERLLEDDSFSSNAARLGRAIRSEVEEGIAVKELERIVGAAAVSGRRSRSADRMERSLHPG